MYKKVGSGTYAFGSDRDSALFLERLRHTYGVRLPSASRRDLLGAETYSRSRHLGALSRTEDHWVASFETAGAAHCFLLPPTDGVGLTAVVDHRASPGYMYPRIRFVRLAFTAPLTSAVGPPPLVCGQMVFRASVGRWAFVADDVLLAISEQTQHGPMPYHLRLELMQTLLLPQGAGGILAVNVATDPFGVCIRPHVGVATLPSLDVSLLEAELGYEPSSIALRSMVDPGAPTVVVHLPRKARPQADSGGCAEEEEEAEAEAEAEEEEEEGGEAGERQDESDLPVEQAYFYVRMTPVPDVFELYASAQEAAMGRPGAQIAAIPSLRDSQTARTAAEAGTATLFKRIPGKFDGRWTPHSKTDA